MALVSVCVFCLLIFVNGLSANSEFSKDGDILILNTENFEMAIESIKNVLVVFYEPWCEYSRAMMPDFAEAATKLVQEGSPIKLAEVDCDQEPKLADKYDIESYPTIKFFNDGKVSAYTGNLDTESFISFVKSHSS